jgi:hypothetical protein
MYRKNIIIILFLFGVLLPIELFSQNNSSQSNSKVISSKLTRDSILIGDQVEWRTKFMVPLNAKIAVLPYNEILKNVMPQVEVIADIQLDTVAVKEEMSEMEARLILTSFDSGFYKLPKPLIVVRESPKLSNSGDVDIKLDTLQIETPSLAVNTMQIDTASFTMHDIKGQIKYPVTFKEILPWILLALLVLTIVYVVYRYVKYRRENKNFFGKEVSKDPPYIVALRKLENLRNQKLWQNAKYKQFYTGVTDALREYIESNYKVSAMEKTSSEIIKELEDKEIDKRAFDGLKELLQLSDLVKFAKYIPLEADNEEAVPKAVTFVNTTHMQSMEEEIQNNNKKEGE